MTEGCIQGIVILTHVDRAVHAIPPPTISAMPRFQRLGLTLVLLLFLSACGTEDSATTSAGTSASATIQLSESESPSGDEPADAGRYVSQGGGWSAVVPSGWEVGPETSTDAAFVARGGIAEVLVQPATAQPLEELAAQRINDISMNWEGAEDIESEIVPLPAGDAVRIAFSTASSANAVAGSVTFYVLEAGDTQYVLSVRGTDRDLATIAEALAESLRIRD